ncbi:MAG: bifunctional nuclease family protein, partial [Chitinispirillaceae bacterium]|nr:bifunctional nuclease family protein [Chitinispirillaceae bacterium]
MIRVEIVNVFLTAKGDEFIVLLRGPDDARTLPISIGQLEAQAIAIPLYHISFPRPLTHDLFKAVLGKFDSIVEKVVISDIIDNTFYARLFLSMGHESVEVDARPSDALALAIRFGAPVYVDERVMEESGLVLPAEMGSARPAAKTDQTPAETLKEQLAQSIREERYEDAARLRDA